MLFQSLFHKVNKCMHDKFYSFIEITLKFLIKYKIKANVQPITSINIDVIEVLVFHTLKCQFQTSTN